MRRQAKGLAHDSANNAGQLKTHSHRVVHARSGDTKIGRHHTQFASFGFGPGFVLVMSRPICWPTDSTIRSHMPPQHPTWAASCAAGENIPPAEMFPLTMQHRRCMRNERKRPVPNRAATYSLRVFTFAITNCRVPFASRANTTLSPTAVTSQVSGPPSRVVLPVW